MAAIAVLLLTIMAFASDTDAQMDQIGQGIGEAVGSMAMIPVSIIGSAMQAMKAVGDVAVGMFGQAASMFGSTMNQGGMSGDTEEVEVKK
ncbi:unnamed protein product [Callosobruchus maculatus]|uniref:Uncharacterized protein n=1 Tax=Callosobruchus maculatus TaxID=64391 RepID=A0A653CDK5_CALMS|nr:unnamed protein product [Callosobruchus maculatus]